MIRFSLGMDKLPLTGQNLGWVFNLRCGHLHAATFLVLSVKLTNLQLKTQPKQLLGSVLLVIALPDLCNGLFSFWVFWHFGKLRQFILTFFMCWYSFNFLCKIIIFHFPASFCLMTQLFSALLSFSEFSSIVVTQGRLSVSSLYLLSPTFSNPLHIAIGVIFGCPWTDLPPN
jgi:hypothetical protein